MYRGGNGSDWRVAFSRVPSSCRYRADQRRRENASIPVCLQILPLKSYVRILSLRGESILWSISTIFMSISIPGHSIRVGHHILRGLLCAKSIRRVFPRFREWSGEMFCRTAETNTAVENFSVHSRKLGKTFLKDSVQNGGRPTRKRIKIISPPWKIAIIRLRIPLYAARNCRPSSHWMNIKPGFLKIPVLPHNKQTLSRMLKHCSACFEFHLGSGLIFSSIWLSPSLPPTLLAPRHSPFPFLSPARTFSWSTLGHSYFGTININYQHSASCWR